MTRQGKNKRLRQSIEVKPELTVVELCEIMEKNGKEMLDKGIFPTYIQSAVWLLGKCHITRREE